MTGPKASPKDRDGSLGLFDQSGVVVSVNNWSETDVGGVVWNNGGHISSTKTEVMQLFMLQEDGREVDLKINNTVIAARAGHYLSIVWAQTKDASGGVGVALVNHSTARHEIFKNRVDQLIGKPIANLNGCFFSVLTIVAAMIFGSFLGELASVLISLGMLAIPISLMLSVGKTKRHRSGLRDEYIVRIEAYVRDIMSREDVVKGSSRG